MSHFTVLVIGENIDKQLAPFQENNMDDCPKEYLKFFSSKDDRYKDEPENDEDGYWENPNAKWDWYSLGGRWSGMIKLKDGATGTYGRPGVFDNTTGIDSALIKDIANLSEIKTFALLKDGVWYERGEMGWFGVVSNERASEEWDKEYAKLLSELPEDTRISIIDCHI
jgi:hypothetical protein